MSSDDSAMTRARTALMSSVRDLRLDATTIKSVVDVVDILLRIVRTTVDAVERDAYETAAQRVEQLSERDYDELGPDGLATTIRALKDGDNDD